MSAIGVMAMPADFRYRDVFLRGKPQHDLYDAFRIRHPRMDTGKRAKIFSPFDALKGFNDAVASKNVQYTDRTELTEEDRKRLNRQLHILKGLTFNSRMARANRVIISVTYYVPCSDENNEAYGLRGQYQTLTGVILRKSLTGKDISAMTFVTENLDNTAGGPFDVPKIRLAP